MQTRIKKWGNSFGVRIPQAVLADLNLHEDSKVDLKIKGKDLVIRPLTPRYELNELLASISPDNIHNATEWGKPVGKEVW